MTRPILTITAALVLVLIGFGSAAPRPASDSLPGVDQARTGAPQATGASEGHALRDGLSGGAPDSGGPTIGPMPPPAVAVRGVASWCAPTPKYCHGWGGHALLAAVPTFSYGDTHYRIEVCRTDGAACVQATVVSFCACRAGRVVDLSPFAFTHLAPLSAGVVRVEVERVGPGTTPPATDT